MTKEEILPQVIEYFKNDKLAAGAWIDKYAMKDKLGNVYERTPIDMFHRLAKEFARIEKKYLNAISEEKIFELLDAFKYLVPQGSPMFGIGNSFSITSLSNCFVLGSNNDADSYGSIFRTDEELVQLSKRRGGVGINISHLRPSGSCANNADLGAMAGAVLYTNRYSRSTQEVAQNNRRGALMILMSIEHPDAEKFIDAKLADGAITGANISVRVTDKFMEAVKNDYDFIQTFPIKDIILEVDYQKGLQYDKLVSLEDGSYIKKIKAKRLWYKIISNAHHSAEPGILFWDNILRESPADCYKGFRTHGTNPCAELPLCEYDSCRLLAINLYSYVINPFKKNALFDEEKFKEDIIIAQRLMDDLVDLEIEKIDKILSKIKKDPEALDIKSVEFNLWHKIRDKAIKGRRTGLGITAEGDMLAALGLTYGSDKAIKHSVEIHKTLATYSYISSIILAKERGHCEVWEKEREKDNPFVKRVLKEIKERDPHTYSWYEKYGRRNIANLTIAPAGTTSLMTQTSSGIEPCFNVAYKRRRRTIDKSKAIFTDEQGEMFEEYYVFHHKFVEWYDLNWSKLSWGNTEGKKSLESFDKENLDALITLSPYYKATAADVDWVAKVRMQGEIQKWVDHSISATTNIPKDTSIETVDQIYMTAYESGCKGMTIYREGSRSGILINEDKLPYIDAVKRPEKLHCDIYQKTVLKQDWTILVGKLDNKPYEIFAYHQLPNHQFPSKISKGVITKIKSCVYTLTGTDEYAKSYVIPNIIDLLDNGDKVSTRQFSLMLRHHIDPKWIVKDIASYAIVTSFSKAIERVLRNYTQNDFEKCPECGGKLTREDGCAKCLLCGYSKCG